MRVLNLNGRRLEETTVPNFEAEIVEEDLYTITSESCVIWIMSQNGGTLNLPTAVGKVDPIYIMNNSIFSGTIVPHGTETINDDSTLEFLENFKTTSVILIPVGGNWYVF